MMDNRSGKGLSFVKRIYLPRIIGLGIGLLSVAAALAPLSPPAWVWMLLLFHGLLWPHVAYQWALRSAVPFKAEHSAKRCGRDQVNFAHGESTPLRLAYPD
nr:diguanylate cyclase [Pseudomonas plecoglossicida NB2011]